MNEEEINRASKIIGEDFEYLGLRCRVVGWYGESMHFPAPPANDAGDYPRIVHSQDPVVISECISLTIVSDADIKTRTLTCVFAEDVRKEFVRQLEARGLHSPAASC